jgi:beta-galactosidase
MTYDTVSPGTLVCPRVGDDGRLWVVVNMDGAGGHVSLPAGARDLRTGRVRSGQITLGRYEYRVYRLQTRSARTGRFADYRAFL